LRDATVNGLQVLLFLTQRIVDTGKPPSGDCFVGHLALSAGFLLSYRSELLRDWILVADIVRVEDVPS
jgi:hypothetical protein